MEEGKGKQVIDYAAKSRNDLSMMAAMAREQLRIHPTDWPGRHEMVAMLEAIRKEMSRLFRGH